MKKVSFVIPNTRWFGLRYWNLFPYTIGLLIAVIKDKYEIEVLDANLNNWSFDELKSKILDFRPDYIAISCTSFEYDKCFRKIAQLTKEVSKDTIVIVGGIYPTLLPKRLMEEESIDYAVIGEGEYRFPKLLEYLDKSLSIEVLDGLAYRKNGEITINPVESYIQDLDSLPFPCYDYVDFKKYTLTPNKYSYYTYPRQMPFTFINSTRGCPYRCIFCSSRAINGPKIRYRSAKSMLKEIDEMVTKYDIREVIFIDDNIFHDRERIMQFAKGLIERDYDITWKNPSIGVYTLDDEFLEMIRKSGCYQLALAIESPNKRILRIIRKPTKGTEYVKKMIKKLKELGFEIGGLFVIGTPGETWEEIRQTIKFAEEIDVDQISLNIATPLPQTELYKMAKEGGMLPPEFSFDSTDFYGFGVANITTEEFTPMELQIVRAYEWDRINFSTQEKEKKVAKMNGVTLEELREWRKSSRRNIGVNVKQG